MKNILLVGLTYPGLGGIERSFEILDNKLKEKGHSVTIISQESKENENSKNILTFKYSFLNRLTFFEPFTTYFSFKNFLYKNRKKFDNTTIIARHLPISFVLAKCKISHTFIPPCVSKDFYNGMIANIKQNEQGIKKYLKVIKWSIVKFIYQYYESFVLQNQHVRVCTFSQNVKNNLLLANNVDVEIEVCYPGIEVKYFESFSNIQIAEERQKNGFDIDSFVVLYVGRIDSGKNIHLLIDAFQKLDIENKMLVLVGAGHYNFNNSSNIKVMGKKSINELKYFYNIANVMVLPTFNEGFGQVLIESLGCGTPVVGFDTPNNAINEIITDELFGLKTEELTARGLANTILQVYNEKIFYSTNRQNIEASIKNKFSWSLFIERVLR